MSETTTTCTAVRLAAAELALGILVGSERAAVLAHLETCAECRAEVQSFAAATDALFQLAPEADPPAGFEVRLLARRAEREGDKQVETAPAVIRSLDSRRTATTRMRALLAAAAVVLLGAGVGVGSLVSGGGSQPRLAAVRAAELSWHGSDLGDVVVAPGNPSWVFMSVQDGDYAGWVRCVVTENGKDVTVGRFLLHDGYGGWAVPLSVAPGAVSGARLELDNGTTIASASL
ncbi:MAG: zf-HC2 domain-containing protein [Acidimicrobiales bacterium]|jgi:anti-sigma factor RsiW